MFWICFVALSFLPKHSLRSDDLLITLFTLSSDSYRMLDIVLVFYQHNTFCLLFIPKYGLLTLGIAQLCDLSFLSAFFRLQFFVFSYFLTKATISRGLLSSLFWSFICQSFQIVTLFFLSLVWFVLPKQSFIYLFDRFYFQISSRRFRLIISVAGFRGLVTALAGFS